LQILPWILKCGFFAQASALDEAQSSALQSYNASAMSAFTMLAGTLRKRAYSVLIGVALLIFGAVSFRSLLISADREIVYDAAMVTSFCAKAGNCFGIYELKIGNTGRLQQDGVTAVVHVAPSKWTAQHSISDLAADHPRAGDPAIKSTSSGDAYTFAIDRFAAGTEIKLRFDCATCSLDELKLAKATAVEVHASGTLLQGDPRVTTLGRRLNLLLTFF
jgi:hypothetical protein